MSSTSKPPYFQDVLDALENFRYEATTEEKQRMAESLDSFSFLSVSFSYDLPGAGEML